MMKNLLTRTASTVVTRAIETVWFIAGASLVIAERALSTKKTATGTAATTLKEADPLDRQTDSGITSAATASAPAPFEPFEELSDLSDDFSSEEESLEDLDTTEASASFVQLTTDEVDVKLLNLLGEFVERYPETPENPPSEDTNAPF
jgi:hypothetical protein